jgi:hypothetical protein
VQPRACFYKARAESAWVSVCWRVTHGRARGLQAKRLRQMGRRALEAMPVAPRALLEQARLASGGNARQEGRLRRVPGQPAAAASVGAATAELEATRGAAAAHAHDRSAGASTGGERKRAPPAVLRKLKAAVNKPPGVLCVSVGVRH